MPVSVHKYTKSGKWEEVILNHSEHNHGDTEDLIMKVSRNPLGVMYAIYYGSDPSTAVYIFNGMKLVKPLILKEPTLPEPTLAQRFLAGIPEDVLERLATVPLKEWLQEMIINFATDDAHEVYPVEFFSEGIMDLAGGVDAPEFEGYKLSGVDELDDAEDGVDLDFGSEAGERFLEDLDEGD